MARSGERGSGEGRARLQHAGVCAVVVAAVGSIVALRVGAPLVSVLVVGLLLLCPLLLWAPFRFQRRASKDVRDREVHGG